MVASSLYFIFFIQFLIQFVRCSSVGMHIDVQSVFFELFRIEMPRIPPSKNGTFKPKWPADCASGDLDEMTLELGLIAFLWKSNNLQQTQSRFGGSRYLRIQSRARMKKSLLSWCSSRSRAHCSSVTDMDVRSLALLQLVNRIPFRRRQTWTVGFNS